MGTFDLQSFPFLLVSAGVLAATGLAVTRRSVVHAVLYLVFSFLGTALLFYLLGAPLLAALGVIIYAGAILVVFLFVLMLAGAPARPERFPPLRQWLPAGAIGAAYLFAGALLLGAPLAAERLPSAEVSPRALGIYVFRAHGLSVELASLLLLVGAIGALVIAGVGGKKR